MKNKLKRLYYKFTSFFKINSENIRRSFAYAKLGWTVRDWDHAYIWDVLNFKLKRLEICIKEDPHHKHKKENVLALKTAIKITKNLRDEVYDDLTLTPIEKKWGKRKKTTWTKTDTLIGGKPTYTMGPKFSRTKIKTEKDHKQYVKDCRKAFKDAEKLRIKDLNDLNKIFINNLQSWWT